MSCVLRREDETIVERVLYFAIFGRRVWDVLCVTVVHFTLENKCLCHRRFFADVSPRPPLVCGRRSLRRGCASSASSAAAAFSAFLSAAARSAAATSTACSSSVSSRARTVARSLPSNICTL